LRGEGVVHDTESPVRLHQDHPRVNEDVQEGKGDLYVNTRLCGLLASACELFDSDCFLPRAWIGGRHERCSVRVP
jgi:hypothetical protein